MLRRRRRPAPWVRVVLLGPSGDAGDGFVTVATFGRWREDAPLPKSEGTTPVATPEVERLRARVLVALDVVLAWALRRGVLTRTAADHVRLVMYAAIIGIVTEGGSRTV